MKEEIHKSSELREKEVQEKAKTESITHSKNELTITNNNITQYKTKRNNLNLKSKANTFVFEDCFTQDCFYYNKKKLRC